MSVLYDIQGVQSRGHAERGIARYLLESATALERHHPGVIDRFLLNPDLHVPDSVERLTSSGRLELSDRIKVEHAAVYHVGSPIELDVLVSRLWPRAAQAAGVRLVATLYDLIPRLLPDRYLTDPLVRRRYETRLELVRRADRILAISAATAHDAVEHLGVRPDRISVVGTGVSDHFRPAADPRVPFAAVRAALPEIKPGFVLYTGGIDARKNIDGLLGAYAVLPAEVRSAHQLVVVCRVSVDERAALEVTLKELAIADRVVFTGFVPDALLVALYQSTDLFVFPSLYEGFGLPVAEAIASGAPVAISRIPSLTEVSDEPAAQFDPRDPRSIAEVVGRCLSDDALRARLRAAKLPDSVSWRSVADRTAAAYSKVAAAGPRSRRRSAKKRVAFVTPLPPQRSGVADDSFHLIAALAEHCEVDAIADGEAQAGDAPPGIRVVGTRNFHASEALTQSYDRVFYCLGNSEFHSGAFDLLRDRPGVVIAHDVRLSGLYGWIAAHRPELLPGGFASALHSMYGSRIPVDLGKQGWIDFWEANRHGVLMARDAIARSETFLVHSNHAAQLARLDAASEDEHKVDVLPFRFPAPAQSDRRTDKLLVATFGLVSPAKQPEKLLEAWALVVQEFPEATLGIVGSDAGTGEAERLRDRAEQLGIGANVVLTGDLEEAEFRDWMTRATIAVQLRAASNGETSAVVAQCLAAGTPTIVTAIGAARELSDDAVVKVDREAAPGALADAIVALLRSPERRASLSQAGEELARAGSFEHAAELLYERYVA